MRTISSPVISTKDRQTLLEVPLAFKSHSAQKNNEQMPLGGSALRSDSLGKVTGTTQYVEDMQVPGMLHMKVVRSPSHHARLRGIDPSRAAQMPGVKCVITWKDIPGVNGFPDYSIEEPVLTKVGETLRMKGAPIALIVAEEAEQAEAARAALVLDLEPLPYTFDMAEALKPERFPIAGEANELSRFQVQHGDLNA